MSSWRAATLSLGTRLSSMSMITLASPAGEPRIPRGQVVWRVFSVKGAYVGSILFPEGVAQPYWIEGERIVATRRDTLGVATIESYRLTLPEERP